MRGLLLTNYYLIHRSFLTYTGLAIVISAVIFLFCGSFILPYYSDVNYFINGNASA
ncbi:spore coat protein CotH [Priestia megaterium]